MHILFITSCRGFCKVFLSKTPILHASRRCSSTGQIRIIQAFPRPHRHFGIYCHFRGESIEGDNSQLSTDSPRLRFAQPPPSQVRGASLLPPPLRARAPFVCFADIFPANGEINPRKRGGQGRVHCRGRRPRRPARKCSAFSGFAKQIPGLSPAAIVILLTKSPGGSRPSPTEAAR